MTIIKTAFHEGRETDVNWENSESHKKILISEIKDNNIRIILDKLERGERKKIQQICPLTGDILRTFSGVCSASRWIISDNNFNNTQQRVYQINGNMRMCMLNGYKCYGYYWKVLSKNSTIVPIEDKKKGFPNHNINFENRPNYNKFVVILKSGEIRKYASVNDIEKDLSLVNIKNLILDNGLGLTIDGNIIETERRFNKIVNRRFKVK